MVLKTKEGTYEGGIWTPKVNNPLGHNKHTKKELLVKNQPKEEVTVESVKKLYQELRQAFRNYLSAKQKHSDAQFELLGYRGKIELNEEDKE